MNFADVQHRIAQALRVAHFETAGLGANPARIADLPALLGVEARFVENESDLIAGAELARSTDEVVL
jgi:hypothetical protein